MMNEILMELLHETPIIALEVAIALLPVIIIFIIFQVTLLKLPRSRLIKISLGMVSAFFGLLFFFLGVTIGFSDTGIYLGEHMGRLPYNWILIPVGLLIGLTVVLAEPAVHSLVKQVEAVSGGMVRRSSIYVSLSIGVGLSVALSLLRTIWGINLWFLLIPGYLSALILAKYSPRMFTAIAFDSGGVATGPMTSTFVLSFSIGVTSVIPGANPLTDAFGIVAMVAMTPLITIQILGILYQKKARDAERLQQAVDTEDELDILIDDLNEISEADITARPPQPYNEVKINDLP